MKLILLFQQITVVKFKIPEIKARKVGIQLPDGLKREAIEISDELERMGYEVMVSGESCYGACDIDMSLLSEVDILLHFAHTPILKLDKVLYIPYFVDYDVSKFENVLSKIRERRLALISTAQYCHRLGEVKRFLEKRGFNVELKGGGGRVVYAGQVLGCNYTALSETMAEAVLFIGDGLFHAIGAAIYSGKKVYALNPLSGEISEVDASEFIRNRYLQISRCVGLNKAGILVSSKPGQRRLKLAEKMRKKAENTGIRAYIVYINEVTPEKLYNLPFDFYVNTACPRITYDDADRFSKPIITPQEFDVVLGLTSELRIDEIL